MKDSYSVMLGSKGKEAYPRTDGATFDESGAVFTMRVRLEPGYSYEFTLNSEQGGSFQSRAGVPLKMYAVRFRTAAAKP